MDTAKLLLSYPDGVGVFDSGLNALFANPALREMLRISRPITGRKAGEIFLLSPKIVELLETFFKNRTGYLNYDFTIRISETESITAELSISSVNYGEKEDGAVLIIRPNEGRKELHSEIEKEEKMTMLSMIATGLAHEIKNPLGGIRGTAQLIGQTHEELTEYCNLIVKETDRVSSLVNELLDLRGEREPRWEYANIHKTLDETIKLMETVFRHKDIEVIRDYDPSLPNIKAEPNRLKQVFINLVKNGVEVMEKGGTLRIKTRTSLGPSATTVLKGKKKTMMSIEFTDNGRGIPPNISKHLFTPFNTSKKRGVGLGLVLSLKIIRDHGGTLTLENNPDGRGATARVVIPIKEK